MVEDLLLCQTLNQKVFKQQNLWEVTLNFLIRKANKVKQVSHSEGTNNGKLLKNTCYSQCSGGKYQAVLEKIQIKGNNAVQGNSVILNF